MSQLLVVMGASADGDGEEVDGVRRETRDVLLGKAGGIENTVSGVRWKFIGPDNAPRVLREAREGLFDEDGLAHLDALLVWFEIHPKAVLVIASCTVADAPVEVGV